MLYIVGFVILSVMIGIHGIYVTYKTRPKPTLPSCETHECLIDGFDLHLYLERIEREHIALLVDREKECETPIELWWGLDGLALFPNGTTKPINRRDRKIDNHVSAKPNVSLYNFKEAQMPTYAWVNLAIMQQTQSIDQSIRSMQHSIDAARFNSLCPPYLYCGMGGIENSNINFSNHITRSVDK